jgi:hypothetical protein
MHKSYWDHDVYHHNLQNDVHHSVLCNDAIICYDFLDYWYNDNLYKFVLLFGIDVITLTVTLTATAIWHSAMLGARAQCVTRPA